MKAFLKFAVPLVLLSALLGCSTTGGELPPVSKIPPGVAFEGTLANHVLAQDASLSIRNIMGGGSKRVDKFVIQKPVGKSGRKAWRELWIYDPEGVHKRFIVTFREDGQGSADFEIQRIRTQ